MEETDIPDSILYWHFQMGGLALHNPFVGYRSLHKVPKDPEQTLEGSLHQERTQYEEVKARFLEKAEGDINLQVIQDLVNMPFMTQEEFRRYCDWVSEDFGNLYIMLED